MEPSDLALFATLDALLQESSVSKAARRVGLSTPAMSHALGRIRERLGDPLLVRAGRQMVLTPRAEALRPKVRAIVAEASRALVPEHPFSPAELARDFVIRATDYVLTILGGTLDQLVAQAAPDVVLRFVPNSPDDAAALRAGEADLAVGIYGELPPELRTKILLTDRFVCVVRADHPQLRKRPAQTLSLAQYLQLDHVQIAPRGRPGGHLDDVLAQRGLSRRVRRAVPYFLSALRLVAATDYVLTVSERIARVIAPELGLRIVPLPVALRPYALKLIWHPRFDGDPAHEWLRGAFQRAVQTSAADLHQDARTRLEAPPRRPKKQVRRRVR